MERNIIGTVSHKNGNRAELELVENVFLFSVFDSKNVLIVTGRAPTAYAAGYHIEHFISSVQ